MAVPTQSRPPSPDLFFETVNAYQRTAALKAAIALDLFTAIGAGATTAAALAERLSVAPRGARILCDYLVVIGFLTKQGDQYGLTPDSAMFLDRRSPAYVGGAVAFLGSPMVTGGFDDVATLVRQGGRFSPEATVAPEHPVWVDFAKAMAPMMYRPAELLAELAASGTHPVKKVLDLAAGHGLFGIAVAQRFHEAVVVAVDWPNVLAVAEENARQAGIADRFRSLPGSAFDVDYGEGHDLVLLTNFLHHFDQPSCVRLLRKVHAALAAGGRAIALEFVPDENRVTPPLPATFAFMMLGTTPSGDAYTASEYAAMFREAGFSTCEARPMPPTPHQAIIARR
jgi:ubiquinone/menaquinone biosynthesis C-methylase UbiE